jgi:glyoxylase-like metal-dependent hydrolase (beta-lactamase superfamily II)
MRMTELTALVAVLTIGIPSVLQAQPQPIISDPVLPERAEHASAHVYVIKGFPNVGIIVGDKATLVVDTGLGPRIGATVARVAKSLSTRGQRLYLTTTHFHPEHASGQAGFPADVLVIRNRAQQDELESDGERMLTLFRGRPQFHELLEGVGIGQADMVFDRALDLDLGGVHARLLYFGAAHTRGDEITFVPEDSVMLPGDVVQNQISPNIICASCSPRQWIAVLDRVAPLQPKLIIPDHGGFGGVELIAQERAFLVDLQNRAMSLKAQGRSAAEAGRVISEEFARKYSGWQSLSNLPQAVERAYQDPSDAR